LPYSVFITVFAVIFAVYEYQNVLVKRPEGIHRWRQSDCASIALNYYQNGMKFFEPEIHNIASHDKKSGKAVGEFPLLYYVVASLYHVFGYSDWLYRTTNFIIFFIGLFAVFKLVLRKFDDLFWATNISMFFFASPVLLFYAGNYLTDSTSLALCFAGWFLFFEFLRTKTNRYFYFTTLVFTLATLLKVAAAMNFIAIGIVWLLYQIVWRKQQNPLIAITKRSLIFSAAGLIIAVLSWYFYASSYCHKHQTDMFSLSVKPIWSVSGEWLTGVMHKILTVWIHEYYNIPVFVVLLLMTGFIIFKFKQIDRLLLPITGLLGLACFAFFTLFYMSFMQHDYYVIILFTFPLFILLTFFDLLKNQYSILFKSIITKVLFAGLMIFSIAHAKAKLVDRYEGDLCKYPADYDFHTITPYLRSIGVMPDDKTIVIPDGAPDYLLYLTNQTGWTDHRQFADSITRAVDCNAKFLIVNNLNIPVDRPVLKDYISQKIGQYNQIAIYRIDKQIHTYATPYRLTSMPLITCDLEQTSADKQYFISETVDSLHSGNSQSTEFAYSGMYSSKLDKTTPYSMTYRLNNVKFRERYVISVLRKQSSMKAMIVAQTDTADLFYRAQSLSERSDTITWQSLKLFLTIPKNIENKSLKIYLWNPDTIPAYFDNFRIEKLVE